MPTVITSYSIHYTKLYERAHRLQRRPRGHDPGKDPRSGLLCAPECGHAREDRHSDARGHAAHEPGLHRAPEARGTGAGRRPRGLPQRGVAVPDAAPHRNLRAAAWMGVVCGEGRSYNFV